MSWLGRRFAPDVLCLFPQMRGTLAWQNAKISSVHRSKAQGGARLSGNCCEHERMKLCGCVVRVIASEFELDEWLPPL